MTVQFLLAMAMSKGLQRYKLRIPKSPPAFINCEKTAGPADLAARWSAVSWRQSRKFGDAPVFRRTATPAGSSAPTDSRERHVESSVGSVASAKIPSGEV
ncbi:unnamed protein product [Tuber aestivum]|uniref:Uncharacterized protein n=1 Tax=Tuber aestivum TaxID=59557 RepID=A0A292Q6B6_9PEZI|nr:unnamed protein product [Tuber aestivum]